MCRYLLVFTKALLWYKKVSLGVSWLAKGGFASSICLLEFKCVPFFSNNGVAEVACIYKVGNFSYIDENLTSCLYPISLRSILSTYYGKSDFKYSFLVCACCVSITVYNFVSFNFFPNLNKRDISRKKKGFQLGILYYM